MLDVPNEVSRIEVDVADIDLQYDLPRRWRRRQDFMETGVPGRHVLILEDFFEDDGRCIRLPQLIRHAIRRGADGSYALARALVRQQNLTIFQHPRRFVYQVIFPRSVVIDNEGEQRVASVQVDPCGPLRLFVMWTLVNDGTEALPGTLIVRDEWCQ